VKKLLLGATAASLLVAAVVTVVSLFQTPTYEVSALVVVHPKDQSDGKIQLIPNAPTPESLRALVRTMALAIEIRPVAEETIRRLGLEVSPDQLLDTLTVEPVEGTPFLRLRYTDTDPEKAVGCSCWPTGFVVGAVFLVRGSSYRRTGINSSQSPATFSTPLS
jgi:capsular polysaccharide biosynthesis protein